MLMKKLFFLLFTMSLIVPSVQAQNEGDASLLKAVEKLRLALLDADPQTLDNIASEKLNYWHSSGVHQDKATFIKALVSGESDFVTLDFTELTTTVSGDVGVVHHILSGKTNDGGKPGFVKIGVTLIFQKEGNEWKLLARQAFKLPA